MNYNTLIISPHCDDEVLGCGGILNNRKDDGSCFVYYIGADVFHVVTRGERMMEVSAVAEYLNFQYKVGNNTVNHYQRENLINEITDVINETQPEEIFIPNSSYNQDHKEVYDACIIALRPHDLNHFVHKVFIYEVDQYCLWHNEFNPNYFEAIDVKAKVAAYNLHASQVRLFRPPALIEHMAYIRGLSCKAAHAESFKILRYVNKK